MKRGILQFCEKISKNLKRPEAKFVSQMCYGMLASQSCLLTEIGRNLNEEISLKKTVTRLSRNLNQFDEKEQISGNYLDTIAHRYNQRSTIIIDGSDVTKKASSILEGLCEVRDGSTGEIGTGYYTIGAAILSKEKKLPCGVYSRIFSTAENGFESENTEYLNCFRFLSVHFSKENTRTMDRGFDNNLFYGYFIEQKEKFIIRAKQNRDVIYQGEKMNILILANKKKGKYRLDFQEKGEKQKSGKISIFTVSLPEFPDTPLQLITVYGFGKIPMMLLTNLDRNDDRICVTVCKVYLMRWRIEEYFKCKKQCFDFENFRVQSLNSIRTLDLLLTIAIGYISELSNKSVHHSLFVRITALAKRLYGNPDFVYYAISDGIFDALKMSKSCVPKNHRKRLSDKYFIDGQLQFPNFEL